MDEVYNDPHLWAGLNKPDIGIDEADIVIFGIPYDGAVSFRSGAKDAPDALRRITYTITPTTEDFECFSDLKVLDLGNVDCSNQEVFFKQAEELACRCAEKKKFFIAIGGDHSVTIPLHRGVDKGLDEDFGIIHIDAHFDMENQQSGNLLSHGSVERRAIELKNVNGLDAVYFIGIRSIEFDEWDYFRTCQPNVLSAKQVSELGWKESARRVIEKMHSHKNIYLTIDIDNLDPGYAAGTGTPQFGGLTPRELLNILSALFAELPIIGMDVVEVAPGLDPSLAAVFAARKIVTECMGHWYRKNRRFSD